MSVVLHSPFARGKRLLEEDSQGSPSDRHSLQAKRTRVLRSPAASTGRCSLHAAGAAAYAISPATLSALLTLFPTMDDKTVTAVLVECGSNIDAAIQRLTQLRLSSEEAAAAAAASAPQQAQVPPAVSTVSGSQDAGTTSQQGPQTAEQWVDLLVSQMAASKDMNDARSRAAGLLQMFETFVKEHGKDEVKEKQLAELTRENAILKKAVQIQNTKLQEKAGQDQELQQLRGMIAQYQEQLRKLELHNYSLTMHLQQATSGAGLHSQRPPDVY